VDHAEELLDGQLTNNNNHAKPLAGIGSLFLQIYTCWHTFAFIIGRPALRVSIKEVGQKRKEKGPWQSNILTNYPIKVSKGQIVGRKVR
jgi:hypothetical protein